MKIHANSRGFSLIEVMVAVLVLGVAVAGLVRGLTTSMALHKDSERLTVAALMASGRIELLRADARKFGIGKEDVSSVGDAA